nr:hypothetical protein [Tanacetum cinerariifolium]
HGMLDQSLLAGLLHQIDTAHVRQALVAQQQVIGFVAAFQRGEGFMGIQGRCQQIKAMVVEQNLQGDELERVIFYQQDSQVAFEHRSSQAERQTLIGRSHGAGRSTGMVANERCEGGDRTSLIGVWETSEDSVFFSGCHGKKSPNS